MRLGYKQEAHAAVAEISDHTGRTVRHTCTAELQAVV